ncbi:MAG: tRNA 2-thiouridine(34) synthase MnmA [bacterium]
MKRVIIGMSGGVDSAVAAFLLQLQGFDIVGFFLHLNDGDHPRSCCSLDASYRARRTADSLGIPFYVFNAKDRFAEQVISFFKRGYESGLTPNPCIECNRAIKFRILLEQALTLDADFVAMGHYARVVHDDSSGEWLLLRGIEDRKDQSYFLYGLEKEWLPRLLFPVGGMTKTEVTKIATDNHLIATATVESMDLCFFQGQWSKFFGERDGSIVDESGRTLGAHRGAFYFTVGQRKGIGVVSDQPLYVKQVDAATNQVVLAPRDHLFAHELKVGRTNWLTNGFKNIRCAVKHRSGAPAVPADVHRNSEHEATVRFDTPVWAPAPGQAAVFYTGDRLLGGGTIQPV